MRKKTHEEYVARVAEINSNIEVVGKYINNKIKILHRCKIDGFEWYPTPNSILDERGCPMCKKASISNALSYTHSEYVSMIHDINSSIDVIESYVDARTPILHMCKIDGYTWKAAPTNVLKGTGCPMCAGNLKKTTEQYVKDVKNIDINIKVLGQYVNAHTPILHECQRDGCKWMSKPTNVLSGEGCPTCCASRGEKIIRKYLESKGIIFIQQHVFNECKNIKPLHFDFYLPDNNMCIEYDGRQHFEPVDIFGGQKAFEDIQKRDAIKTNYCLTNNIQLLRVRYDEDIIKKLNEFFN